MVERSAQRVDGGRPTAEADLAEARAAINRRDFDAAILHFRRLRGSALEAEGDYGLGWIAKEQGRVEDADRYFRRAIDFDPGHAHSYWQLGKLALGRQSRSQAETLFLMALEAQPGHVAALEELAKLGVTTARRGPPATHGENVDRTATATHEVQADPGGPIDTSGPFGVYEYLLKDRSVLSRQAVAVLDRLRVDRYPPTYLSFFGFAPPGGQSIVRALRRNFPALASMAILLLVVVPIVLLLSVAPTPGAIPRDPLAVLGSALPGLMRLIGQLVAWAYVAIVLIVLLNFLRHITTRIRIERGRLQVDRGLLTRTRTNLELWRVQSIFLERRGLQLLTGDGSLVFHSISGIDPITITGVARGRELERLHEELLDLIFLLRTNPSIKGLVQ